MAVRPFPDRWVEYYLGNGPSLGWLLVANAVAVLVGLSFYVPTMPGVNLFLWPLYADSPTALVLATLSLATLLPRLGRGPVRSAPSNRALALLHTLAFVWLVKYAVWTVVALNVRPDPYLGFSGAALWDYWGIILTHLAFLAEAYLLPHYGETSRAALAVSLVALLANDAVDYGLGLHPPLRYEPGWLLATVTVGLSLASVGLAALSFDRLDA